MEGVVSTTKPVFSWEDPLYLDQQLDDEERMVRDTARQFARDVLLPRVITDFCEESFDPDVMRQMGQLGLLGPTIPEEVRNARPKTPPRKAGPPIVKPGSPQPAKSKPLAIGASPPPSKESYQCV